MPARGRGGKGKGKVAESEEDQLAFLEAAAAANQATKAAEDAADKAAAAAAAEMAASTKPAYDLSNLGLPPRERLHEVYPAGETQEYVGYRTITAEDRDRERREYVETVLPHYREGAEIHRQVRKWAVEHIIRPGVNLYEMCAQIEEAVRRLSGYEPVHRGLAFPCGCSLNNVAAHYTPTHDDGRVLQADDVMKVDYGININGHVIDSAFTVCFDERFKPLLEAAREATNAGVKAAGIDARLSDVGDAVQEVFDAATLEVEGKTYRVKPVSNLYGHMLGPYRIHAGKSLPLCRGGSTERMEEGEAYACETFGTTGKGRVTDWENISHFMVSPTPVQPRTPAQRKLLQVLQDNFSTLAFTQRFLDYIGQKGYSGPLRDLCSCKAVNSYPALADVRGSWVAQCEHTFILLPTRKEILTRGDDY